MEHKGTKTIETERLTLRPFRHEDARAAFANWTGESEVTRFLTWPTHADIAVTEKVIDSWIAMYGEKDFYQWAIVLKDIDESIGSISVVRQDERINSMEVGYCIGSRWWHKGIVSEAFGAVIRFLFDEVGVNRVAARHDPNNPHSGGVMRKCGLKYEGTLRSADINNQGLVDVCVYSILREEYEEK